MTALKIRPVALKQEDVADFLGLSVSTLESLVRQGDFPKPRQLAGRRVGWLVRELEAWVESRPVSTQLPPPNTNRRAAPARP
ncbi:AlpA family phage regulatory protein [Polaromonas sp. CG_23.6]|uniref:helix-turn-helix transcriptional regulator n=1 Tax=Polaromonas sp. CG_23.6 TaxID=2760709 RepID=UPI002473DF41|nr:AlpA family phage regulatory protein [Polaromonas sp. CG_23.6]MDH6185517.1 prophage regulatory protein [Polaromonas sp. CG_23.6]